MMKFTLCDDQGGQTSIKAADMEEAIASAQEWAQDGDYNDVETVFVTVRIYDADDNCVETVQVSIEPEEPRCFKDNHSWEKNTVSGHGGGVIIVDQCQCCGLRRSIDTWAQNPDTGEQGMRSLTYR